MKQRRERSLSNTIALACLAASLPACEAIPERAFIGRISSDGHGDSSIVEMRDGKIALLDAELKVKWAYRPRFPPPPPLLSFPQAHLICPPAHEREGPILLTFPREIHAVHRDTGKRMWRIGRKPTDVRAMPANVLGRALLVAYNCPAVTPDSGMVVTFFEGLQLRKYNADGARLWEVDLEPYGRARVGPHVLWPSGNILVRAKHDLLLFSPDGKLNQTLGQ